MRIFIANRGEIARRIIRTAHRLGHSTVAAFADPDADAPFVREATTSVRLGPAALAESYLSAERLLAAVAETEADAVHPGYGFLSESAGFAGAVQASGATWIGPSPAIIASMGSKIEARGMAAAAGVPVIPGFDRSQAFDDLFSAADRLGYPVLVKAALGGGGKGIRVVGHPSRFAAALIEAADEAERYFGDRTVIVERFIERPRHVEVQVVGDRFGDIVHLGTRECSVQRRYQKLLEEAPAPNLSDGTRAGLQFDAVRLATAIGYDSVGTVEFVVDDVTGEYYFLEMNTRLQVEHPVTEAVTGLDLVELQLRTSAGEPLSMKQSDVNFMGHAFEARINAEDPARRFTPQAGTVTHVSVPFGTRWDSAVEVGSRITTHYDSMVAKLILHGADRQTALRRLRAALDVLILGGLVTNSGLHRWLVDQEPIIDGRVTTRFLDEVSLPGAAEPAISEATAAWIAAASVHRSTAPWSALGSFRITPHEQRRTVALTDLDGNTYEAEVVAKVGPSRPASVDLRNRTVAVNVDGYTHTFFVSRPVDRWSPTFAISRANAQLVVAPFPGIVTELPVKPGQSVDLGDPLVVLEAMKMLHTVRASAPGVVGDIRVEIGDQVESRQVLITFADVDEGRFDQENP